MHSGWQCSDSEIQRITSRSTGSPKKRAPGELHVRHPYDGVNFRNMLLYLEKEEMTMKTIAFVVIVSFFVPLVSGCAAMFHGTKETIHVRSEEPATSFFVNNREIGKGTSAVTTLPKKDLRSTVLRAEKKNCHTKSSPIETSFDAVTLLGIFWDFGIISILVIDWAATGAVTQAAQTDYILTPECPK